jgi:hypothetical protein
VLESCAFSELHFAQRAWRCSLACISHRYRVRENSFGCLICEKFSLNSYDGASPLQHPSIRQRRMQHGQGAVPQHSSARILAACPELSTSRSTSTSKKRLVRLTHTSPAHSPPARPLGYDAIPP